MDQTKTDDSVPPSFTSDESKVQELFQLIHASLQDQVSQPPGVVRRDVSFLQAGGADVVGCKQIGMEDGFFNYIYRLGKDGDGQTVVVKWARQIPRVAEARKIVANSEFTRGGKMFLKRNANECRSVLKMSELVPGSTPEIYWLDADRHFFIMEDLADSSTLRKRLTQGKVVAEEFETIARFFGKLHRSTFISQLSDVEYDRLDKLGPHPALLNKIYESMYKNSFQTDVPSAVFNRTVFSDLMQKSGVLKEIIDNPQMKETVGKLAQSFHRRVCFIHNDSHPGSYMVKPNHDVKVIDFEMSCFGNPGKDIGYALGEMVIFHHVYIGQGKNYLAGELVDAVRSYLHIYRETVGDDLIRSEVGDFWSLVAGYAGHFVAYKILGSLIPFREFEGLELEELKCIRHAINLMKHMERVETMEDFMRHGFTEDE